MKHFKASCTIISTASKLGALRRAGQGRGRVEPGRVKLPETGNARRNFTI
ncbi:MAG: hypothetical protein M3444_14820 [Acidobacteriota bacterium]|nr:hypothetical protein [Acidobacteriota bacterium]